MKLEITSAPVAQSALFAHLERPESKVQSSFRLQEQHPHVIAAYLVLEHDGRFQSGELDAQTKQNALLLFAIKYNAFAIAGRERVQPEHAVLAAQKYNLSKEDLVILEMSVNTLFTIDNWNSLLKAYKDRIPAANMLLSQFVEEKQEERDRRKQLVRAAIAEALRDSQSEQQRIEAFIEFARAPLPKKEGDLPPTRAQKIVEMQERQLTNTDETTHRRRNRSRGRNREKGARRSEIIEDVLEKGEDLETIGKRIKDVGLGYKSRADAIESLGTLFAQRGQRQRNEQTKAN